MIGHFQGDVTCVSHIFCNLSLRSTFFSPCFLDEVPSVPRLEWHEIIVRRKIALKEKSNFIYLSYDEIIFPINFICSLLNKL